MSNYKLDNNEIILFEGQVTVKDLKTKVNFTLTSKKIVFEKEKGIFKKKLKAIDIIPLVNIKVYKESVQIKRRKSNITIQTIDRNISLSCSNTFEAKVIVEEIIKIKTGYNIFKRSSNKLKKAINVANDVKNVAVGVAAIAIPIYNYFKDRQ